ncbi:hypothetical protein [Devriesea agamarum]|nr:hypothetical protein [Devriesea agamarum]
MTATLELNASRATVCAEGPVHCLQGAGSDQRDQEDGRPWIQRHLSP